MERKLMIAVIAKYAFLGISIFVLALVFTKLMAKMVEKLEEKKGGKR